jgi:serine/threonine-protein kinase
MVNFIVAKALAKGVEDRYQNAKDFAVDLRSCRDTLPRSSQYLDLSKPRAGSENKSRDTIGITGRTGGDDEIEKSSSNVRLSKAFDSSIATLRLAALTATSEDVDELSKTLNVRRPTSKSINQAGESALAGGLATSANPMHGEQQSQNEPSDKFEVGSFLVIAIALLILAGFSFYFVF